MAGKHCIWSNFFRPSPALASATDAMLASLLGPDAGKPYAAAHLRLGGLRGELNPVREAVMDGMRCNMQTVLAVQECGLALASQLRNASSRLLLVSDNSALRRAAAAGRLSGVAGPGGVARHSKLSQQSGAGFLDVFTELYVLGRAACLVKSHSGYSEVAHMISGTSCFRDVTACKAELGEALGADAPLCA